MNRKNMNRKNMNRKNEYKYLNKFNECITEFNNENKNFK